jgi:hypothetical protein
MSRKALIVSASVAVALIAASPAFASGGPGGGGCAPLTTVVKVPHADGNGNFGINVEATMRNCSTAPEPLQLNVVVPKSTTIPFKFSTGGAALQPGRSLTINASPIGSTPTELHYGQTYNVFARLTQTGPSPKTLATIVTPVTIPAHVVA